MPWSFRVLVYLAISVAACGDDAGSHDAGIPPDGGTAGDAGSDDASPDATACDDADGDTVCDADDVCPGSDDRIQTDGDGLPDDCDNCPGVDNLDQTRCVLDLTDVSGDACDDDDDGDGALDADDSDDCNRCVCNDSDGDGCDDCFSDGCDVDGSDDPAIDGPECTDERGGNDGLCDPGDPDDDGDGCPDATDIAICDDTSCGDCEQPFDGDGCDDCVSGTGGPDAQNDGPDSDGGGFCDAADNCDDDLPESQTNGDGDAYGDVCDICAGGDDDIDPDADTVPTFCDNCPDLSNTAQQDTDPTCDQGTSESATTVDLGNACDNCDQICNDQTNSSGIRATPKANPTLIGGGDCVDSSNGHAGDTDDLELGDDDVSRCFDLDDENMDGTVVAGEAGDFGFSWFGQSMDAIRISNNGYLLLFPTMADCANARPIPDATLRYTDPQPDAGIIPIFDGTDNIVAAGWTNLKASTHNPLGVNDPCVSVTSIGDNFASNQILEVTWETARLFNDDDDQPVTMQIRLSEGTNEIEIISAPFNTNLEPTEADQVATRGVEGLFFSETLGVDVVAAAYLGHESSSPGDDEVRSVLQLTNSGVEFRTALTTAGETAAEETGDACDNLNVVLTCGDGVCHADGGESSSLDPAPEPGEPDPLYSCLADCACTDTVCDFGENEDVLNQCGECPQDCNPGGVPERDGCCGDGICDTDEGEDESGNVCGLCPADCASPSDSCCGDSVCHFGDFPILIGGVFFCTCVADCPFFICCGDGVCDASNAENGSSCPSDC